MAAITASPSVGAEKGGEEALQRLSSADPWLYLSPSSNLSCAARLASGHLFSSLLPFCPKPPSVDRLLTDDGFDAEQIWWQIDEMSRSCVSMIRRELKRLERDPPRVLLAGGAAKGGGTAAEAAEEGGNNEDSEEEALEAALNAFAEEDKDEDADEDDDDESNDDEEGGAVEGTDEKGIGVDDGFLKTKELNEFLVRSEAKYATSERETRKKDKDEDEDEEKDEEDLDDLLYASSDSDSEADLEDARYDDFYGSKKKRGGSKGDSGIMKNGSSKKVKFVDELEDSVMDDEQKDDEDAEAQDGLLSTHEKELQKIHSKIEEMEKANLEPKSWTMQGEVTAAKRPKNSALEVDLDFEHNMRPAPVITEEVTVSLEELIKKRIIEGRFDDVQRAPTLPSKAPKERKELDENKSKKGLAEIYEEEYAQKAGLVSAPLSSSDALKKEATSLWKNLCLKLDALSHFHFAPKPNIEDMSIQVNVPALAMEEIAPLAVSDAAMLAPEEIFEGKGDIKEEMELTQADRKRRRASKKRRYKAGEAKRAVKRARVNADPGHPDAGSTKRGSAMGHPNGKENSSHKSLRKKDV